MIVRLQTLSFLICMVATIVLIDISGAFADSSVGKVTYIDGKAQATS